LGRSPKGHFILPDHRVRNAPTVFPAHVLRRPIDVGWRDWPYRLKFSGRSVTPLLHVVDQIQIRQRPPVFINVVIAVRGDQDGADIGDAGDIRRHKSLPGLSVSRRQVEFVDFGRHLAEAIHKYRAAVGGPIDRNVFDLESSNGSDFTAVER
jgi:hypothetical protein